MWRVLLVLLFQQWTMEYPPSQKKNKTPQKSQEYVWPQNKESSEEVLHLKKGPLLIL